MIGAWAEDVKLERIASPKTAMDTDIGKVSARPYSSRDPWIPAKAEMTFRWGVACLRVREGKTAKLLADKPPKGGVPTSEGVGRACERAEAREAGACSLCFPLLGAVGF